MGKWKIGDLVIHTGDMKSREFLMRVVGINNDEYTTKYVDPWAIVPNCQKREYETLANMPKRVKRPYTKAYVNFESALLAPSRFGINAGGL